MVGLLAWAADVVGGGGGGRSNDKNYPNSIPHAQEVYRKLASLNHSIQDLRLKLQPPDIPQRLPDIHAHSPAQRSFSYQEKSLKYLGLGLGNLDGWDGNNSIYLLPAGSVDALARLLARLVPIGCCRTPLTATMHAGMLLGMHACYWTHWHAIGHNQGCLAYWRAAGHDQ
ncbi:Unknown protein [Striga hermonthica]|uniref:Uncharacterized protein n=1 Tax=Striga hermonthica TaxID=68872 RepID=A0A9N7N6F7_STRHE|nr:Unknown protein [Striga hermonthica]